MNDKQLIERLRHCGADCDIEVCQKCPDYDKANCMEELMTAAADRISDFLTELRGERHRHDRYVDFELAQAEELERLKEKRNEETLPAEELQYIIDCLPTVELLCQLAEEASELGKAALKLRRILDGINPTPVPKEDALKNLYEEIADVMLVLITLGMDYKSNGEQYHEIMVRKTIRWANRMEWGEEYEN